MPTIIIGRMLSALLSQWSISCHHWLVLSWNYKSYSSIFFDSGKSQNNAENCSQEKLLRQNHKLNNQMLFLQINFLFTKSPKFQSLWNRALKMLFWPDSLLVQEYHRLPFFAPAKASTFFVCRFWTNLKSEKKEKNKHFVLHIYSLFFSPRPRSVCCLPSFHSLFALVIAYYIYFFYLFCSFFSFPQFLSCLCWLLVHSRIHLSFR